MSNDSYVKELIISISSIYETFNIFQSVIIADDSHAESLYNLLIYHDFPVVMYEDENDVQAFVACDSRILLVTMAEIDHFVKRYVDLCGNVNIIISTTTSFDDDYIADLCLPPHVEVLFA